MKFEIINESPAPMKIENNIIGGSVDSTSDQRTVNNNLMRHAYRVLTDEEKEQMRLVKDYGLNFVEALHRIGGSFDYWAQHGDRAAQFSRELQIAQQHMEEAVMWAVKHITR